MRPNTVKHALKDGRRAIGTWLSMESVVAARFMARCGFDWLTVDLEHGPADWQTACYMFAAIAEAGCVPLARVPANRHDHIKRALDTGAMGVVVPMVNSRSEAEAAVEAARYPPEGTRSVGGSVHALNFAASAADYFSRANREVLVVLQCEHIAAVERADEIFSVAGIDAIFVGPNDLAASMRDSHGKAPSVEATTQAMRRIYECCVRHGVAPGLHCMNAAEAVTRLAEGWRFVAVASELRMMLDGAAAALKTVSSREGQIPPPAAY